MIRKMSGRLLASVLGVAIVAASSVVADAGVITLDVSTSTVGTIPNGAMNDLIPVLDQTGLGLVTSVGGEVSGRYGADLVFSGLAANDVVKFTFYGKEAAFRNSFQVKTSTGGWTSVFQNDGAINPQLPGSLSGLDSVAFLKSSLVGDVFRFGIDTNATSGGTYVTNGTNPDDSSGVTNVGPNFFVSGTTASSGGFTPTSSFLLWLDDGGGSNDDNHDDMVVLVESIDFDGGGSTLVPEPGSIAVWSVLGLACVGGLRRRRRAAKS